ncbi:MAG TPA: FliA/WhiG family RNA polymerase sigma factor [Bacillota bacterium]|nr:FliA/WhiG family RNA polymerase sigma factor [Bacillota bacterium]
MSFVSKKKDQTDATIYQYLPLVKKIVGRMKTPHAHEYEKDDLISIGVIGLIEAVNRYDSKKGVPFEHFAKWRITGAILDELRKNGRISRARLSKIKEVNNARNILRQRLMREPREAEICEHLSISLDELFQIENNAHLLGQFSLEDMLFSGDGGGFRLFDIVEDKDATVPDEKLLEKERKKELGDAIEKLTDREKLVLSLYYKDELTLREIGEVLEVTVSRVSQIHGRILTKLRGFLDTR